MTSIDSIPAELRGKATVSVPTAAKVLGIGRDAAYAAVRTGQIVSLHFANRIVVPTAPLLRMIGVETVPQPTAGGASE